MMDKLNEILDDLEIKYPNFYDNHSKEEFEFFKYRLLSKYELKKDDDLDFVVKSLIEFALGDKDNKECYKIVSDTVVFNCLTYSRLDKDLTWAVIKKMHDDLKDKKINGFILDLRKSNFIKDETDFSIIIEYIENSDLNVVTIVDDIFSNSNKWILGVLKDIGSKFVSSVYNRNALDSSNLEADIYVDENIDDIINHNDTGLKAAIGLVNNKNIKK